MKIFVCTNAFGVVYVVSMLRRSTLTRLFLHMSQPNIIAKEDETENEYDKTPLRLSQPSIIAKENEKENEYEKTPRAYRARVFQVIGECKDKKRKSRRQENARGT